MKRVDEQSVCARDFWKQRDNAIALSNKSRVESDDAAGEYFEFGQKPDYYFTTAVAADGAAVADGQVEVAIAPPLVETTPCVLPLAVEAPIPPMPSRRCPAMLPKPVNDDAATTHADDEVSSGSSEDSDEASDYHGPSIAGDTVVGSEVSDCDGDETEIRDGQPEQRGEPEMQTSLNYERHESAPCNRQWEVGNFGLYLGNWGERGCKNIKKSKQQERTEASDRQIRKNPGMVVVLVEATKEIQDLLEKPAEEADDPMGEGLAGRSTNQYRTCRTKEKSGVLIAARTNNTWSLQWLYFKIHFDGRYRKNGKQNMARTRILICEIGFKQNIGYIGNKLVVAAVHGHYELMKWRWPQRLEAFWDRLAKRLHFHKVHFLAGDFSMSFTEVVKQLGDRGLIVDCVAWHPWQIEARATVAEHFGFDSCGIFFIGGKVEVKLDWDLQHLELFMQQGATGTVANLPSYPKKTYPGQKWTCFKSFNKKEPKQKKNLKERLTNLLTPSTTRKELYEIACKQRPLCFDARMIDDGNGRQPKEDKGCNSTNYGCKHLKIKQKAMDDKEWRLENGEIHKGAHFPLLVLTAGRGSRSKQADDARKLRSKSRRPRPGIAQQNAAVAEEAITDEGTSDQNRNRIDLSAASSSVDSTYPGSRKEKPSMPSGTPTNTRSLASSREQSLARIWEYDTASAYFDEQHQRAICRPLTWDPLGQGPQASSSAAGSWERGWQSSWEGGWQERMPSTSSSSWQSDQSWRDSSWQTPSSSSSSRVPYGYQATRNEHEPMKIGWH